MKKKILLLHILCLLACSGLQAQEDVLFSNRQLRIAYNNPAYIPELLYATITLGGRMQWTGLEGAPQTFYAGAKYFFIGAHSQIGLSVLGDKIGYHQTLNPKITYAFIVPIWDDSYLNLGIGAGLINRSYDAEKIDGGNTQGNPELYLNQEKGTVPDMEVGFELLIQNFELGVSANHILKGDEEISLKPLFSGYANYLFQTDEWWRLVPSYSVYHYNNRWKHQAALRFCYVFDYEWNPSDLFYVEVAFRPIYEGTVSAGVTLFSFLSVFYSYDYFFGNLRHGNYGSHEIGLEFKIPQKFQGCYANYGKSKKYTRYTRSR
jgi:type IX secretion system PorP/SprF family membrane protein